MQKSKTVKSQPLKIAVWTLKEKYNMKLKVQTKISIKQLRRDSNQSQIGVRTYLIQNTIYEIHVVILYEIRCLRMQITAVKKVENLSLPNLCITLFSLLQS